MFFLIILIPYVLFSLLTWVLLARAGWNERPSISVPLSLGLGPLLFAWGLEVGWTLFPGAAGRLLALALGAIGLVGAAMGLRGNGLRVGALANCLWPALIWIVILGLLWFAADGRMQTAWDPQATRMLADRIVAEGNVFGSDLMFEPTLNDLIIFNAFHGLRQILLLAANRLAFETAPLGWDALPTVWYVVAGVLLAGGMVCGPRGWWDWRPWLVAVLILSSSDYLRYPLVGAAAGSLAGFACAAVFATCMHVCRAETTSQLAIRWLVVGATLGLVLGIHRTAAVLAVVPLCFGIAAGVLRDRRTLFWCGMAAILAAILYSPFGFQLAAATVDPRYASAFVDAVYSYQATYREAFQPLPAYLAFQQFLSLDKGAVVWWGGVLGAFVMIADRVRNGRWQPWRDPCAWAFAVSAVVITIVVSDMLLMGTPRSTEIVLRSTRYRQMVVPVLAVVAVWGLSAFLRRFSADGNHAPFNITGVPIATAGAASALLLIVTFYTVQGYLPRLSQKEILTRLQQMFVLSDRAVLEHTNPGAIAVLRSLQERGRSHHRVLLDWMAVIPFIDSPVVNPWLPPGVLPLMDAAKPRTAWEALRQLDVRWVVLRPRENGSVFMSSTGIRLALSLSATSLIYDEAAFQVFERREQFLEKKDIPSVEADLEPRFLSAQLKGTPCTTASPLFTRDIEGPGDFELSIKFASKGGTLIIHERRNGKAFRKHYLRSWLPYVDGPQRVRFNLRRGDAAQFHFSTRDSLCGNDIDEITLRRAPLAENLLD